MWRRKIFQKGNSAAGISPSACSLAEPLYTTPMVLNDFIKRKVMWAEWEFFSYVKSRKSKNKAKEPDILSRLGRQEGDGARKPKMEREKCGNQRWNVLGCRNRLLGSFLARARTSMPRFGCRYDWWLWEVPGLGFDAFLTPSLSW